jgi:hypothetical protein
MVMRPARLLFVAVALMARVAHADHGDNSGASPTDTAPPPAAQSAAAAPTAARLHHVPISVTREHQPLSISATLERPDLISRAVLVYRSQGVTREVDFARSGSDSTPYVAVIPGEHVVRPGIEYAVEIVHVDGSRSDVFATRSQMQAIEVIGDYMDVRQEALLARLHGRRFIVEAGGQYASFGPTPVTISNGNKATTSTVSDSFYQVEGAFTYRLLSTISEFGLRVGVLRGSSSVPGATDASQLNVGLNYGAPWLRLRATDWLHFEGELLTSVTQVGFSVGGGGAVLLGDPYTSYLTVGFESIQTFGTRGYARFQAQTLAWMTVAPMIEVTTMPNADSAGVRLLMDLGFDLSRGFLLTLRGGYQARSFASGGPAVGASLGYAF